MSILDRLLCLCVAVLKELPAACLWQLLYVCLSVLCRRKALSDHSMLSCIYGCGELGL